MADINDFKAGIAAGVIRQHRWEVDFAFPSFAASTENARQASVLAQSSAVPEHNMGKLPIRWGGRNIPIPGDREFADFSVTFILTQDLLPLTSFERWHNGTNGLETNSAVGSIADIVADVSFYLLDDEGNRIKQYRLNDAWPMSITGIEMDMTSENSYATFTVTFAYYDIRIEDLLNGVVIN